MWESIEHNTLFDEWDASLECGSGVICVSGPSGCGKTHSLLQYLMSRERALQNKYSYDYTTSSEREDTNENVSQQNEHQLSHRSTNDDSMNRLCEEKVSEKSLCQEQPITSRTSAKAMHKVCPTSYKVVLVSAKCVSTPNDALARFTEAIYRDCDKFYDQLQNSESDLTFAERQWSYLALRQRKGQLHRRHSINALRFGQCVQSWKLLHGSSGSGCGGELHCILDDADAFNDESIEQELSLWWQGCEYAMCAPYTTKRSRVEENKTEHTQEESLDFSEKLEKITKEKQEKERLYLEERKRTNLQYKENLYQKGVYWSKQREPTIVLWIVSQLPLRIAGCFRYHMLRAPSPSCIVQWITNHFEERQNVQQGGNRNSGNRKNIRQNVVNCKANSLRNGKHKYQESCIITEEECNNNNNNCSDYDECNKAIYDANDIERCVLESVKYYTTHQPMRSSILTHDIRLLLHRVYALLPLLMKEVLLQKRPLYSYTPCQKSEVEKLSLQEEEHQKEECNKEKYHEETSSIMSSRVSHPSTEYNSAVKLNALHFARAWSQYITNLQTTLQSSPSTASAHSTKVTKSSKETHAHELNKNVGNDTETSTNVQFVKETLNKEEPQNQSKLDLFQCIDRPQVSDPIVQSLSALGYSAILLAFTSFYCGAVPRSKISDVLGTFADGRAHGQGKRRRRRNTFSTNTSRRSTAARVRSEITTQSHKASVLTSSAQAISCEWLLTVYNELLQIVIQKIDPLEFACASAVVHVIDTFVKWGLLVHLVHGRVISPSALNLPLSSESSFRCFIPVATALLLGEMLSINLYELIPT